MTADQKNLTYLAGAGILGYFLLFRNGGVMGGSASDPTGNGSLPSSGYPASFNAQKVATDLYEAMRYSGSNEDKMILLLRSVTQAQFGQVMQAFGEKQYNKTFGNQQNPTAWFDQLEYYNLVDWLENEVNDDQYYTLKLKYPQYL